MTSRRFVSAFTAPSRAALASLAVLLAPACSSGTRTLRAPLASDPVARCLAVFVQPRFEVRAPSSLDAENAAAAIQLTLEGNRALQAGNCLDAAARFEAARGLSHQHPDRHDVARFRMLCPPCASTAESTALASR